MSDGADDGVFRLEGGEKHYDNYIKAVTVAEAKAEDEEQPIRVFKKQRRTFEPVVRIYPDGSQDLLDG